MTFQAVLGQMCLFLVHPQSSTIRLVRKDGGGGGGGGAVERHLGSRVIVQQVFGFLVPTLEV